MGISKEGTEGGRASWSLESADADCFEDWVSMLVNGEAQGRRASAARPGELLVEFDAPHAKTSSSAARPQQVYPQQVYLHAAAAFGDNLRSDEAVIRSDGFSFLPGYSFRRTAQGVGVRFGVGVR